MILKREPRDLKNQKKRFRKMLGKEDTDALGSAEAKKGRRTSGGGFGKGGGKNIKKKRMDGEKKVQAPRGRGDWRKRERRRARM